MPSLAPTFDEYAKKYPNRDTGWTVELTPWREARFGGMRQPFRMVQLAVGVMLLFICVSVAVLMRARTVLGERSAVLVSKELRPGVVLAERIESRILLVRGEKVMFDSDLAVLYRVSVKRLNEAIRRNRKRFPQDFMFQLSKPEMAILRSVELGLSTARCANTGVSMLIDPYGRVVERTPLFKEALLTGDVWVGAGPTLFLQWGDWVTSLCLGLTLILVVISWYRPLQRLGTALTPKG